MPKWIERVVEYDSFGDAPVLIVAPHEGTELVEVDGASVVVGERGSGELAKIAAKHVGGSYIVVHVPRFRADFARSPELLGEGAMFRFNVLGKRHEFTGHKDTAYKQIMEKFHNLVGEFNPKFLLSFHKMLGKDVDIRLGFGLDRKYIGNSKRALEFRKQVVGDLAVRGHSLEILVSKRALTGESEYILNRHHKGRLAALVEFSSSKGFDMNSGHINPGYREAANLIAEQALRCLREDKTSPQ